VSEAQPPAQPPEDLLERTLTFCRLLRQSKFSVTHARAMDVFRSLRHVDWSEEADFRTALRSNLASSRDQEIAFDRLFDSFWRAQQLEQEDRPFSLRPEPVQGELEQGWKESHRDLLAEPDQFSPEEVSRDLNLANRWDEETPPLEPIIKALAKRIASRPSRRRTPARNGSRIDMRRSMRLAARDGFDLMELLRSERRIRKTRIVLLCDVSGSMDAYNPFLLRLMLGLQKELKGSRTVVFSTQVTEITNLLRHKSVAETLREVSRSVRHWSGGTDIGHSLGVLNRQILREGKARSTVAIVVSDGYDQGDPDTIDVEMKALKRRVRSLVWINPMYGSVSYQPTARGMRIALPYVDHFLPAWDSESLRTLVRELATV
jgi:uncharacterized protein with von Willebrand factor type A (vWA) domain